MVARFPEKPSEKERQVLESFWNNFAMLYPCGDCARHFREMLQEHPPQTSSRNAAAGWLCAMHNKVNKRLGKPEYDCTTLGDAYDCGCGDDPKKDKGGVSLKDNHGAKKQGKETGEKTLGLAKARKLVRAVGVAFS